MPSTETVVRPKEAAKLIGVGLSTIRKMAKNGVLPPPLKLTGDGPRAAVGWRRSTIEQWLNDRETAALAK